MSDLSAPFKQAGIGITIQPGPRSQEVGCWIRWGDADYLAARLLFLISLINQATALSNTAIEKYLKAVCCFYEIKIPKGRGKGHDVEHIYSTIKASAQSNTLSLNADYLKLLKKAYRLRYPDELEDGFCIALSKAKMLAQLDRSVLEITRRFRRTQDGADFLMVLDEAVRKNDKRYLDENVAIDSTKAEALFNNISWCYELRKSSSSVNDVMYKVAHVKDDFAFPDCVIDPASKNEMPWETVFRPIVEP